MNSSGRFAKPFATEIAWLLGSWAFSYLLVGALLGLAGPLGYRLFWASPLEIQMHNTYFILGVFEATLPFFLFTALLVTGIRALRGSHRRAATVTLGTLLLFMLLTAVAIGIAYSKFRTNLH
ncbi:hypothetical protein Q5H92_04970 [Hymenobacter sp. M29]|uniref:DUF4149 domain-containing protein n=1 Tax=Hymenobacter mellowenesis TaxID=3063995 RepID=A0ABT9A779_9BACT|nr:hypothetical protein [Hymenobacter sp. M29]MDO7845699.1 hypothetical protein [Hymenobacter sp. M29]